MRKNAACAIFSKQEEVETALNALQQEGFRSSEITVMMPDHAGAQDFAASDHVTRVAQGAELGGGLGFLIGGSAGLLAGIEAFSLPFINTHYAIHPVVGALIGAVFGTMLGAGSGALVGIGTPACPADRYARYLDDGGILVSVHADERGRTELAMDILERCGGSDLAAVNEEETKASVFTHHIHTYPSRA